VSKPHDASSGNEKDTEVWHLETAIRFLRLSASISQEVPYP